MPIGPGFSRQSVRRLAHARRVRAAGAGCERLPRNGNTLHEITGFRTGLIGGALLETSYPGVVSYAIRRCEFDAFLVRRANVDVLESFPIETFRREDGTWIVNNTIQTPVVIGAGGHFCPVARLLRGSRDSASPVIAKEAEFRLTADAMDATSRIPELFFCQDLDGYGWCVRKGDFNVGSAP